MLYILKKNTKNNRDEDNYDWNKFIITSEQKFKIKKTENKDKGKQRVKEFSKGTGFIKEEHKFTTVSPIESCEAKKKEGGVNFLNFEEADNLQDMINFAASINQNEKNPSIYPIESLYSQIMNAKALEPSTQYVYTNEKLDNSIANLLKSADIDENTKIHRILDLYSQLLRMKNKNLSDTTYVGLVEIFMKNGYLSHASYFLCQMDRLKMDIPRSLLDLFLDYSTSHGLFEKKEEITFNNENFENDKLKKKQSYSDSLFNKYDKYDAESQPEYAYYFSRRNHYQQRSDIQDVFSKLKVDAKPFYPKKVENDQYDKIKQKLAEIDTSKVKEFIPKQYRMVKKEEQANVKPDE